jgi:hypothetical protein
MNEFFCRLLNVEKIALNFEKIREIVANFSYHYDPNRGAIFTCNYDKSVIIIS